MNGKDGSRATFDSSRGARVGARPPLTTSRTSIDELKNRLFSLRSLVGQKLSPPKGVKRKNQLYRINNGWQKTHLGANEIPFALAPEPVLITRIARGPERLLLFPIPSSNFPYESRQFRKDASDKRKLDASSRNAFPC